MKFTVQIVVPAAAAQGGLLPADWSALPEGRKRTAFVSPLLHGADGLRRLRRACRLLPLGEARVYVNALGFEASTFAGPTSFAKIAGLVQLAAAHA